MPALVPEVDVKSSLKQRADQRTKDDEAALKEAQERVNVAVPEAHLGLHDILQHFADQHPDSELDGLNAISDGAERFVQLIEGGLANAASLTGTDGHGAPQLSTTTEVRELESQVRQLESDKVDLLAEARDQAVLEATVETMRRDASKQERRRAELDGQLLAKNAEVKQLETAATTANHELNAAKASISDLESQLDVMQASHAQILRDKDAEIAKNGEEVKTFIGKWATYFLDLEERHVADPKNRPFTTAYRVTNPAPQQDPPPPADTTKTGSDQLPADAKIDTPKPARPRLRDRLASRTTRNGGEK